LGESIADIARNNELKKVRNVDSLVEEYVLSFLEDRDGQ
jgi:hypothetical protein